MNLYGSFITTDGLVAFDGPLDILEKGRGLGQGFPYDTHADFENFQQGRCGDVVFGGRNLGVERTGRFVLPAEFDEEAVGVGEVVHLPDKSVLVFHDDFKIGSITHRVPFGGGHRR